MSYHRYIIALRSTDVGPMICVRIIEKEREEEARFFSHALNRL